MGTVISAPYYTEQNCVADGIDDSKQGTVR
jgi:hypothetical protein